jgi:formate hydrogenlyase transcriptional activator
MQSGPFQNNSQDSNHHEGDSNLPVLQVPGSWYHDLVEHSVDLLCVHDLQGRLLAMNAAPARLLGYTVDEILQIPMQDLIAPEYRHEFQAYIREIQEKREAQGLMSVISRSGERRIWHYHNTLRSDGLNTAVVRGIAHDVTDQKQAENALRFSEAHFRLLIEQASDGIFVSNAQGQYLDVNSAAAEMLGYSVDEILKLSIRDIVAPGEVSRLERELGRLEGGAVTRAEWLFRRKDGTLFPGEVAARQLPDGRLQAIVRDISERKLAEHAIETIIKKVHGDSSEAFFTSMAFYLAECLGADHAIIAETIDDEPEVVRTIGICSEGKVMENFTYALAGTPCEQIASQGTCSYVSGVAAQFPKDAFLSRLKIEGYVGTPLFNAQGKPRGLMAALYSKPLASPALAEMILNLFSTRTGAEIERKRAEDALRHTEARLRETNEELNHARHRLINEKQYLEQEIDSEMGFGEIVGNSAELGNVLEQVSKVAPSHATVLLLGETGTGKELIARAVHRGSNRRDKAFIKVNCAAIPSGLLESELFGHEKGAFSGAVAKKVGRLELANNGTLFLDEIGEIPLELQPKLLRVLQDQEFERLGSNRTIKVNFRLIAATNRDLQHEVIEKRFRSDLFYRLYVFPIRIPALRERREDIPLLAEHFAAKHARHFNKPITSIARQTIEAMMQWTWPGNVRELENLIERSVILSNGAVLTAPLGTLSRDAEPPENLELLEREVIVRVLKESRGQLGGPSGAALRLGVARTTLQSKLERLGIDPREFRDAGSRI